jgi:serine/threonine protein kinase
MDFEITALVAELEKMFRVWTLSGDVVGTPLDMSPEQARRRKIPLDHRTDVYSLGATLYDSLCGRPPFRGKDNADTLSQIIERLPPEPRKVNPRVPRALWNGWNGRGTGAGPQAVHAGRSRDDLVANETLG